MQVYDTLTTAERVTGLSEQLVRFPNGKVLKIGTCLTDPKLLSRPAGLPVDTKIEWMTHSPGDGACKGTITAETLRKFCVTFCADHSPVVTRGTKRTALVLSTTPTKAFDPAPKPSNNKYGSPEKRLKREALFFKMLLDERKHGCTPVMHLLDVPSGALAFFCAKYPDDFSRVRFFVFNKDPSVVTELRDECASMDNVTIVCAEYPFVGSKVEKQLKREPATMVWVDGNKNRYEDAVFEKIRTFIRPFACVAFTVSVRNRFGFSEADWRDEIFEQDARLEFFEDMSIEPYVGVSPSKMHHVFGRVKQLS